MITPKKTFGFFFPVKFYSNYEITNKNYFNIRNDFKKLANNFDSTFNNKKFKILVLYESKNTSIEYHPSLFESALQLEVYPNEIFFINVNSVIHRYQLFEGDILSNKVNRIIRLSFNTYYNFEGMDGVLFLNTDNDDAEFIINETKKVDYRKNYFYYQTN